MMTQKEMRKIAIQAARGNMRRMGIDPKNATAQDAWATLGDLYRMDEDLIASIWYGTASENQWRLFRREWNR